MWFCSGQNNQNICLFINYTYLNRDTNFSKIFFNDPFICMLTSNNSSDMIYIFKIFGFI